MKSVLNVRKNFCIPTKIIKTHQTRLISIVSNPIKVVVVVVVIVVVVLSKKSFWSKKSRLKKIKVKKNFGSKKI